MNRIGRPVVVTIVGLCLTMFAAWITASTITNASNGAEVTARSVGFPALLWFLALVALALAVIGWVQRRRYVRSTTPEERAADRVAKPVDAHRPGNALDYGTRLEDDPK